MDGVAAYFAQNMLFFVKKEHLNSYPALSSEYRNGHAYPLSIIHPLRYLAAMEANDPMNMTVRMPLRALPGVMKRSLRSWSKKLIDEVKLALQGPGNSVGACKGPVTILQEFRHRSKE